jgi:hypothetical protein
MVYPGVQALDVVGPADAFASAQSSSRGDVVEHNRL